MVSVRRHGWRGTCYSTYMYDDTLALTYNRLFKSQRFMLLKYFNCAKAW